MDGIAETSSERPETRLGFKNNKRGVLQDREATGSEMFKVFKGKVYKLVTRLSKNHKARQKYLKSKPFIDRVTRLYAKFGPLLWPKDQLGCTWLAPGNSFIFSEEVLTNIWNGNLVKREEETYWRHWQAFLEWVAKKVSAAYSNQKKQKDMILLQAADGRDGTRGGERETNSMSHDSRHFRLTQGTARSSESDHGKETSKAFVAANNQQNPLQSSSLHALSLAPGIEYDIQTLLPDNEQTLQYQHGRRSPRAPTPEPLTPRTPDSDTMFSEISSRKQQYLPCLTENTCDDNYQSCRSPSRTGVGVEAPPTPAALLGAPVSHWSFPISAATHPSHQLTTPPSAICFEIEASHSQAEIAERRELLGGVGSNRNPQTFQIAMLGDLELFGKQSGSSKASQNSAGSPNVDCGSFPGSPKSGTHVQQLSGTDERRVEDVLLQQRNDVANHLATLSPFANNAPTASGLTRWLKLYIGESKRMIGLIPLSGIRTHESLFEAIKQEYQDELEEGHAVTAIDITRENGGQICNSGQEKVPIKKNGNPSTWEVLMEGFTESGPLAQGNLTASAKVCKKVPAKPDQ